MAAGVPPTFRLVAGLGNPGGRYARTRHNVGFLVTDELARRDGVALRAESRWEAEIARCADGSTLMKPLTFMNLSGQSVGDFCRFFQIDPSETLVVLDDSALPLGSLRLRRSGSSGGHNGLSSVIEHLGTDKIPRLRVGIGAPRNDLHDHVLGTFSAEELPGVERAVARAADAVEKAQRGGFESAMNEFNQKTPEPTKS